MVTRETWAGEGWRVRRRCRRKKSVYCSSRRKVKVGRAWGGKLLSRPLRCLCSYGNQKTDSIDRPQRQRGVLSGEEVRTATREGKLTRQNKKLYNENMMQRSHFTVKTVHLKKKKMLNDRMTPFIDSLQESNTQICTIPVSRDQRWVSSISCGAKGCIVTCHNDSCTVPIDLPPLISRVNGNFKKIKSLLPDCRPTWSQWQCFHYQV